MKNKKIYELLSHQIVSPTENDLNGKSTVG